MKSASGKTSGALFILIKQVFPCLYVCLPLVTCQSVGFAAVGLNLQGGVLLDDGL